MGAAPKTLAALAIAVRGRGAALPGPELVGIHRKAHRAAGLAPVEAGFYKYRVQAFSLGLHAIFIKAGFDWREPGCSMCLAMNPDKLKPGERCASTSNRNFEGRQGYKGRTHLVSPAMAAAAAIAGRFVDVRGWG